MKENINENTSGLSGYSSRLVSAFGVMEKNAPEDSTMAYSVHLDIPEAMIAKERLAMRFGDKYEVRQINIPC